MRPPPRKRPNGPRVDISRLHEPVDLQILAQLRIREAARSAVVDRRDPVPAQDGCVREPTRDVPLRRSPEDLGVRVAERRDERVTLLDLGAWSGHVPPLPRPRRARARTPAPCGAPRPSEPSAGHAGRRRGRSRAASARPASRNRPGSRRRWRHRESRRSSSRPPSAAPTRGRRRARRACARSSSLATGRAERRVHEQPVRREAHPERPEVREHELVLRRLAGMHMSAAPPCPTRWREPAA